MKKYYKIINSGGYVLYAKYEKACEIMLGYGGVWGKDHRKAKRFNTIKECQKEIDKTPYNKGTKFLVVSSQDDWKKIYKNAKAKGDL